MSKFSLETKLKAVNDVLELGTSTRAVAKILHSEKYVIQGWSSRYQEHGIEGVSMKSGTYSGDFKFHVIEYMHENSMSLQRS